MRDTTHTPAPWKTEYRHDQQLLIGNDETIIATIHSCYTGSTPDMSFEEQERDRLNDQLIAAAPELLFQLEDILEQINDFPHLRTGVNMSEARKAIAKAKAL